MAALQKLTQLRKKLMPGYNAFMLDQVITFIICKHTIRPIISLFIVKDVHEMYVLNNHG